MGFVHCAAFNTGLDFHLLDHIAPLAYHLKIPLFIEEEKNFSLAQKYYPQVETRFMSEVDTHLAEIAENFDVLFECKYWAPQLKKIFWDFHRKNMLLLACAHGQSDKGYGSPLLRHYAKQDGAVIYGDLLEEMFSDLGVNVRSIFTGNIRLFFYLKHQLFYDSLTQREVFSLLGKGFTALYAPTWKDADAATSFFQKVPSLLKEIPKDWNLIVKVHPLLEQRDPDLYYSVAALLEKRPHTILLSDFPLIYPLLAQSDMYIGDYSSVGYDFLAFQRPMFFLLQPHLPRGKIHSCGKVIEQMSDLLFPSNEDRQKQQELYARAFAFPSILGCGEGERRPFQDRTDAPLQESLGAHTDGKFSLADLPALQYPPASREEILRQIQLLLKDLPSVEERFQNLEKAPHR